MPQNSSPLAISFLLIVMGVMSLALPVLDRDIVPATHSVRDMSMRSTNTCADPSLARTVFQAYNGVETLHSLQFHHVFVTDTSKHGAGPSFWTFQGAVFKAWPTQQPFTVPLFHLVTPTTSDGIYAIGVDAQTPPVVSGFGGSSNLIAWVYDTAACDSVPLMGAALASASDHYYTTDPDEHAGLLADGWTDTGVVAFVLPLPTY